MLILPQFLLEQARFIRVNGLSAYLIQQMQAGCLAPRTEPIPAFRLSIVTPSEFES
jgi:hypothetical protein